MQSMRIVSLFAGAGGLDLGFMYAGHKVIWANDIDIDAVETYKQNIGEHIVHGSIENIPSSEIPDCNMVIGGFPCQGFSVANIKRHIDDSRNKLYLELLRVIKDKKPNYFLAENVKGLATLGQGEILKMIIRDFENIGYKVQYKVLNAADYGVPQIRQRIFIIGMEHRIKKNVSYPVPTHIDPKLDP